MRTPTRALTALLALAAGACSGASEGDSETHSSTTTALPTATATDTTAGPTGNSGSATGTASGASTGDPTATSSTTSTSSATTGEASTAATTTDTGGDPSTGTTGDTGSTGDTGDTGDTGGDELPPCDFFASPEGGQPGADGTQDNPWGPLSQLAADQAIPDEGVLCLLDGSHGAPTIKGLAGAEGTMIRALHRHKATLGTLAMIDVSGVEIWGVKVDAVGAIDPDADQRQQFLVTGDANTHDITLTDVHVESAPSSAAWDQEGWVKLVRSGVDFRGPGITIRDSAILNTYHALLLRGDGSLAENNLIDNFGGDGIRGLGSDSRYSWNTVRDAYIDEYEYQHDDGFQAYKLEGDPKIANVTIDHNSFILFADPITDFVVDNELVGTLMQGIIITDGYAEGWIVENNLVINGQAHGISLFGARNCRVQNNTVVAHPDFVPQSGPWIRIADQKKTGQKNFDNVIRNNLAQMLTPWDYDPSSTVEANLQAPWAPGFFVDDPLDFRLGPASPALDAGIDDDLAPLDLDGNPRLAGDAVDLGAFERP